MEEAFFLAQVVWTHPAVFPTRILLRMESFPVAASFFPCVISLIPLPTESEFPPSVTDFLPGFFRGGPPPAPRPTRGCGSFLKSYPCCLELFSF